MAELIICSNVIVNNQSNLLNNPIVFKNWKEGSKLLITTMIYY